MPSLQNVPFGGLSARKVPNLLQLPEALYADDCYLDMDAIVGRNGYRACAPAAIGSGGAPQHVGRFRPTGATAATVVVMGGNIYLLTDPSAEGASDGVVTELLAGAFGVDDLVSGATLGASYYLSVVPALAPAPAPAGTGIASGTWFRIDSNFKIAAITPLLGSELTLVGPTGASTLAWTTFESLYAASASNLVVSGCVLYANPTAHSVPAYTALPNIAWPNGWLCLSGTSGSGSDPVAGSYSNWLISSVGIDATAYDWLAVGVSPHTAIHGTDSPFGVQVQVTDDVAGATGWRNLGFTYNPSNKPLFGSPNSIVLDLRQMDATTRESIKWIQFLNPGNGSGGKYLVYGYVFLPSQPATSPPINYYVDYADVVTGTESPLSSALPVQIYNSDASSYPDAYISADYPAYSSNTFDSLFDKNTQRVFNNVNGLAMPTLDQIGQVVTLYTTAPAFSAAALADGIVARLWKDTSSGRRRVTTVSVTASAQAITFVDPGGVTVLANNSYEASGSPPALSCLTAHAGRLVGGVGQRLYISSFIPPSTTDTPNQIQILGLSWSAGVVTAQVASNTTLFSGGSVTITGAVHSGYNGTFILTVPSADTTHFTYPVASNPGTGSTALGYFAPSAPLPMWPPIATSQEDGWAYDVYPSTLEQIQCVSGDGDNVYVFTQETVYSLSDLTPGSTPYLVFRRGALGRYASCFAEDRVFWAAYDGVYQAEGVTRVTELTQGIRNLYKDWFAPDARVSMAYQSRKLMVFQPQADGTTRYLRYDFVTQRWTRGTLADSVFAAAFWMGTIAGGSGVSSSIEQLWILTSEGWVSRWQPGATQDNQGSTSPTAIPDWRFSTGFLLESIPFVVKGLLLDSNETCGVTMAKTVAAANALQARTVICPPFANIDEVWEPGCSDFRAMKMRFELSEPNMTVVNRLMFSMEAIREAHGG